MKKFLLSMTALSALLAGSAMAPTCRYVIAAAGAPVVVSYYSWTGCYIGANVGGMSVNKEWSDPMPRAALSALVRQPQCQ